MSKYEANIATAMRLGSEAGHAAGTWAIDGNTSHETAARLLQGCEDGDPEVLDRMPSCFDAITENIDELLEGLADDDPGLPVLDAFGEAFELAYWAEVQRAASYITTHDVFGHPHDQGRATLTSAIALTVIATIGALFASSLASQAAAMLGGVG